MEETADEEWGTDCIYHHTESEDQVPWYMISCKGTPFAKAKVVPKRLNVWKVKGAGIPRRREIFLRCFLAVESDKGTTLPLDCEQNNGEFFEAGMALYIRCSDVTGNSGDNPREGMAIVLMSFLFWRVLDHLS